MKRLILAAALATTTGLAIAQTPPAPPPHGPRMMRMDTDRDGAISRAEAQTAADRRFAKLDTNHDGRVTADEFRARALARFDRRDANRDGRLDQAERMRPRAAPRPGA